MGTIFANAGIVLFFVGITLPQQSLSLYFEEVANLTSSQISALSKFRLRVQDILPHAYMKEDLYLHRFLRANIYRLNEAFSAIKQTVEWRQRNSMDDIDSEDFSGFEDYPMYTDGIDKQGRVIMENNFGEWKIRTAALTGKLKTVKRIMIKAIEDSTRKLRELQGQGKNVTQWALLSNFDGFSVMESACPSCLPVYLNFVNTYEKHYPFSSGHVLFVNVPSSFETVMTLLRPLMHAQSRKVLKIYGSDEKQWRPYLEQHFDYDQIGTSFGGLKVRK